MEKYGNRVGELIEVGGNEGWRRHSSSWWKAVVRLEDYVGIKWFNSEVVRKVGNERTTSFWNMPWRGDTPFCRKYPKIFSISNLKEGCVGDFLRSVEAGGGWMFSWRRNLFVWEEELLISLLEDLEGHNGSIDIDRWEWKVKEGAVFSVKSSYKKLENLMVWEEGRTLQEKRVFEAIWKSPTQWKMLLDRIPTRGNLARRNVLLLEASMVCVLCGLVEESTCHLFLLCEVTSLIWYKVMTWLEMLFIIPPNLFFHWECWGLVGRNKKIRRGMGSRGADSIWVSAGFDLGCCLVRVVLDFVFF